MKKVLKKISGLIMVLVLITILGIYSYKEADGSIFANTNPLSGTKICWGIKRESDHKQPDLRKKKFRINSRI